MCLQVIPVQLPANNIPKIIATVSFYIPYLSTGLNQREIFNAIIIPVLTIIGTHIYYCIFILVNTFKKITSNAR